MYTCVYSSYCMALYGRLVFQFQFSGLLSNLCVYITSHNKHCSCIFCHKLIYGLPTLCLWNEKFTSVSMTDYK